MTGSSARGDRCRRWVQRRVPIVAWLPQYDADKFVCDLIAGVTVGLTVMPQGLAYATLAGLEPQYGLYSAFAGCFVYAVLGGCKDITIGPTALMALMTYQQTLGRNPDFAVLLCFLTGCVQMLMGVLRLGVLIDFISVPVTVGFTSATSVIIAVSQLKGLLGLSFSSSGFIDTLAKVVHHIGETRLWDATLGFTCIVVLLLLRKLKDVRVGHDLKASPRQRAIKKSLWLLSTARNALVVVLCSALAFALTADDMTAPFVLTGPVRSGLPSFGLPPFSTVLGNQTFSFAEMCSELGSSIVLVPIIGVLGNVAIAKAFAGGDAVDATQELVTLGVCNLAGSFVCSMPITGSFSRSAVNHASGVRTPLGGVYTGVLILLALGLLTPYFYFIPKASLAAVIICAVIFMIEYEVVKPMWRSSRKDLVPTFATFVLCLGVGVEYGILIGVAINVLFLLHPSARPSLSVEQATTADGREFLLVTPGSSLFFPAVDFVRAGVGRAGVKRGASETPVVVDCRLVLAADFTAAKGIASLVDDFSKRKQRLVFLSARPDVLAVFRAAAADSFEHVSSRDELDHALRAGAAASREGFELCQVTSARNRTPVLEAGSLEVGVLEVGAEPLLSRDGPAVEIKKF